MSEETNIHQLFTHKEKETWLNCGYVLHAPPENQEVLEKLEILINKFQESQNL